MEEKRQKKEQERLEKEREKEKQRKEREEAKAEKEKQKQEECSSCYQCIHSWLTAKWSVVGIYAAIDLDSEV